VDALRDYLAGMDAPLQGDIDLDAFMISASHAIMEQTVLAEHLSKIWKIDMDRASKTVDITSQNVNRKRLANLSRNYVTNDKMLMLGNLYLFYSTNLFFAITPCS
jgi:hypothetical protein